MGVWLCIVMATVALGDDLSSNFQNPPDSAKPRVWWHWMNGNVTQEGITKDIEWMHRVGIGGFQNFDAALNTPQLVDERLVYMTPPWKDAFRHAIELANQYNFEVGIASSPGWSETGGPWVTPEQAMKKVVWSETHLSGGQHFRGELAHPPVNHGIFQDLPMGEGDDATLSDDYFYKDSVVLAFQKSMEVLVPSETTTNNGQVDTAVLIDGSLKEGVSVTTDASKTGWIMQRFEKPQTVRSLTISLPLVGFGGTPIPGKLEASHDGGQFWTVREFEVSSKSQKTITFSKTTASYFRLSMGPPVALTAFTLNIVRNASEGAAVPGFFTGGAPERVFDIREFALFADAKLDQFESKSGFYTELDYYTPVIAQEGLPLSGMVNLSRQMDADGFLHWDVPEGEWTVLRMGYSLTGKTNHPAIPEATGLEVDKLNREHVRSYIDHYLGLYENTVGKENFGSKGIQVLLTDSIEVGPQNWTDDMIEQFVRLRGYDPTPWLPVIAGYIVKNAHSSERFLWDFRRTIAQLLAECHYGEIAERAHLRGLKVYGEALEDHRPSLGDDMEMRRFADVPMAAMWSFKAGNGPNPTYRADIRGAASVAHLYGQNIVAAESMTSAMAPWAYAPKDLRQIIDLEFVLGVNRPVIHTSVHQPLDDKRPGLSLMIFGQFFNRHETWAEFAQPWISYMARSSYLLQQGRFFGDVCYFYGEEAPLTGLFGDQIIPDAPEGYGYDFINSDVITHLLTLENGDFVTPSGMRYALLYLGGSSARMTLPTLEKLYQLVTAGGTVVGSRPLGTPSLSDDSERFRALVEQMWPESNTGKTIRVVGKGKVITGLDVNEALWSEGVIQDFSYQSEDSRPELMFLHRKLHTSDVYFVVNRSSENASVEATFRISGKKPKLWCAISGKSTSVSYKMGDETTTIPLELEPLSSGFVVFDEATTLAHYEKPAVKETKLLSMSNDWEVEFDRQSGGPGSVVFETLHSWSLNENPGIHHYSGTAVYSKKFNLQAYDPEECSSVLLDLGQVEVVAEVRINGESAGITWHPPYQMDVTKLLKSGENTLEVKVANLWVNRLIGDQQPGEEKPYSFTTIPTYQPDAPLRASGLLGPVRLLEQSIGQEDSFYANTKPF